MWHINFFSLDVEGGEMHVLRTIDFAKVCTTSSSFLHCQWGVAHQLCQPERGGRRDAHAADHHHLSKLSGDKLTSCCLRPSICRASAATVSVTAECSQVAQYHRCCESPRFLQYSAVSHYCFCRLRLQVTFDVVVLEALGDDEEKDASTRSFMEQRGFLFYFRQVQQHLCSYQSACMLHNGVLPTLKCLTVRSYRVRPVGAAE